LKWDNRTRYKEGELELKGDLEIGKICANVFDNANLCYNIKDQIKFKKLKIWKIYSSSIKMKKKDPMDEESYFFFINYLNVFFSRLYGYPKYPQLIKVY
jgi:hypothetical protein